MFIDFDQQRVYLSNLFRDIQIDMVEIANFPTVSICLMFIIFRIIGEL